jgi:hypothetical protein
MIYTITALTKDGKDQRVFGYFHSLTRALKAIEDNECNMEECYYTWIVLEKVRPGIHGQSEVMFWFRWIVKRRQWCLRLAPKWAVPDNCTITNYSMG